MLEQKKDTTAKDGTKLGDFVLLMGKTPMYGRVIEIERIFVLKNHYLVNQGDMKAGEEFDSSLVVERVLNLDLTKPKRISKATVLYTEDYVAVDKDFVKKAFRDLNDMIGHVKMMNEQEGLT